MPHIHTNPGEHDHTVSAFIVRTDGEEPRLLLHKHKKLAAWLQFGGHIELKENPWQAITHEVTEESGYDMDQLSILQPRLRIAHLPPGATLHPQPICCNTHAFAHDRSHFHSDTAYAFVTDEAPRNPIGEDESADMGAFTRSELAAIPDDQIFENVRAIGLFVLDICTHEQEWERISTTEFSTATP